mmetsp:Transcript_8205/g.10452  ORF Transcript_8205/g.10452 Transcript_8205/m.10452 type:complete len:168 (-) Transcript_8205:196-699(-)
MSFFVSSLTGGKPPLLADLWAVKSIAKLYSPSRISADNNHKAKRDQCVENFATILGLKDENGGKMLQTAKTMHWPNVMLGYGADPDKTLWNVEAHPLESSRYVALAEDVQKLKQKSDNEILYIVKSMSVEISQKAIEQGLILDTKEWKKRWPEEAKRREDEKKKKKT